MFRFVRIRRRHARRFFPGVYWRHERKARAYVSWTRSSASSCEPARWRATRYTWSASASASSSKRTRSRASAAMRRASEPSEVVSLTAATLSSRAAGRGACCGLSSVASTTGSNAGCSRRIPGTNGTCALRGVETGVGKPLDERVLARLLVVPGEHDLADEVRLCALEARMPFEREREAIDAALAADPADLDHLVLDHVPRVPSARRGRRRGLRARRAPRPRADVPPRSRASRAAPAAPRHPARAPLARRGRGAPPRAPARARR